MSLSRSFTKPRRPTPDEFLDFSVVYLKFSWDQWEAEDQHLDRRTKPVPLTRFPRYFFQRGILHWMMFHNHIEYFEARSGVEEGGAVLHAVPTLYFTERGAFSLTEEGVAVARAFVVEALAPPDKGGNIDAALERLVLGRLFPYYDRDNRRLLWGAHVLKCFRQPAENQELVLCAAEELEWPEWFDDPLPRRPGRNPKQLLHDTIKDLNRHQQTPLLHFKGDGTGTRIGWEFR